MLVLPISESMNVVRDYFWLHKSSCCFMIFTFVFFRTWSLKIKLFWILVFPAFLVWCPLAVIAVCLWHLVSSELNFYHWNTNSSSGPHSRTVHAAAFVHCLSLTPSSVRGQLPAEGQISLTGTVSLTCRSIVLFSYNSSFLEVFTALVILEFSLLKNVIVFFVNLFIYHFYISNESVIADTWLLQAWKK